MSWTYLALAWERPSALALLLVPLALLLFVLRTRESRVVATSDLEPWRGAEVRGSGARPRPPRRVGPALALALLALASGALAIAGPVASAAPLQWTCVLDTSPSMELVSGGKSRRQRAVDAAEDLARRQGAVLRWIAPALDAAMHATAAEARGAIARTPATSFAAWDLPGALWVTDAAPADPPRFAGFVASGGAAVPGPVAVEGRDRIDWDGAGLVRVPGGAPVRRVQLDGLDLGSAVPLARVIRAWAGARSIEIGGGGSGAGSIALRVSVSRPTEKRELEAGRDGWTAAGRRLGAVRLDRAQDAGLEAWLSSDGDVLVAGGPGRIEIAWVPGDPSDPAAFAVSWASFLDACALPPAGVVPLDERVAAGDPAEAVPSALGGSDSGSAAWILAALATLLLLLALLARRT
ncbi:MAG: hypothetical protein NTY35_16955 [Planctomycetota bacterium]|nr:hypothetical protein [Planctomycetota bacterium]